MGNAEIFIEKYNRLDNYLEHLLNGERMSFAEKVERLKFTGKSKPIIRRYYEELGVINRLRNVIAHEDFKNGRPMADPREDVISLIDEIYHELSEPLTVYELKGKSIPAVFRADEPLPRALRHMRMNDYSQVVVEEKGRYCFLSREDVSRWIEKMSETGPVPDLNLVAIGTLCVDCMDKPCHIAKWATIYEALDRFQRSNEPSFALMITDTGSDRTKPLGVITAMDIIDYLEVEGPPEY